MEITDKRDLITVIDKCTEELHQKIDMHRHLMTIILDKRVGDENIKQLSFPAHSSNERMLKEAVRETIEVLEESRKAFKSKRLEALRKKLTGILIESK